MMADRNVRERTRAAMIPAAFQIPPTVSEDDARTIRAELVREMTDLCNDFALTFSPATLAQIDADLVTWDQIWSRYKGRGTEFFAEQERRLAELKKIGALHVEQIAESA
jgi:hypothetical protein